MLVSVLGKIFFLAEVEMTASKFANAAPRFFVRKKFAASASRESERSACEKLFKEWKKMQIRICRAGNA
jgi:hypothetical protein